MSGLPVGRIRLALAAWQIKQVCKYLPLRPMILLDSEYGNASLLNQTAQIEADFLMRIRSNRCLYSAPGPYTGKGRPRKHGQKFKLNDSSTWWEATSTVEVEDSKLGPLRVRMWQDLSKTPWKVSRLASGELPVQKKLVILW